MLNVRKRATGAVKCCLSIFILLGMMMIAVRSQGGTDEDERMFLALQRPEIFGFGEEWVEVEFFSGPNLVNYQYTVACFPLDSITCSGVIGGGILPIDSVSGSLPRGYSRVLANMTIPDNTDVDCFITVGGGPLDVVTKCQLAGEATTDPGPVPTGYTVTVANVEGNPEALLVKAVEETSRNSLLEFFFPEDPISLSRNYDVTFEVQCLEAPAASCDLSEPLTNGADLFTTGTLVQPLVPNTDYQCFVVASYTDVNGDEVVKCTSADMTDVEPTLPQPPVGLEVVGRTYGTLDLKADYPDPANGDAVFVQGYAFQCSLESECNSSGPWFPSSAPFAADPTTPVTVSGLAEDTTYNCWSATVVGASEPYEYFCSDPVQDATTDEAQLAVVGSPGTSSFFLNALGLDDPTDVPSFEGWAFQCVAGILGSYGPCDPSGTWTSTYNSAEVASATGVEQTGYAPNTDYKCYLGAVSGTTYVCPSTVGGEARVDTAVLTPSSASLATPAVASIAVSNSDAVQQGTADGNTYQYAAQCVPGSALTCVTDGVWTTPALDALTTDVTVAADSAGNAIASNTAYTCFVGTVSSGVYVCDAGSAVATKTLIKPPTVSAAPGTILSQLEVTGTDPTPANPGTTLKVACVDAAGSCPVASEGGWVAVGTSGQPEQVSTLADGTSTLVGGTEYDCWSAEFDDTDVTNRVCSESSSSAVVPLAPPTVLAVSGSFVNQVFATGTNPVPPNALDVTMKVACVDLGQGCPAKDAAGWVPATSATGVQVTTLADGLNSLVGGSSYTCWSAQFDTHDNYKCSATGNDVTASELNRPTVAALPGAIADEVSVTGTDSVTPNQGTTLKVACVASADPCPAYDAPGWVDATSALPVQVSKLSDDSTPLVGGTAYTCWSLEYQTDDPPNSICSGAAADVTAYPLNPPTVTSAITGASAGEIDVTPAAPGTANVGTTLGVACVLGTGTSCPTSGSAFTTASDGIAATVTGLTNGATYECYAAEYLTADDSVVACSAAVPATAAPLNPPTVTSAVPGASSGEIDVTPAAPSTTNVGTTLGVACLLGTGTSCPTAGSSFTSATAGSATTFTGLTNGATYECYAAEYLTADDSVVACSAAVPATAAPLNPPTVTSAVPGASAGEIDVTPAAPGTTNVGTTLGVACLLGTGTSCPTAGSSFTSATAGSATTFTGLTNGATYECYAAEYLTADDSVVACSAAVPATAAPLNPPTVTSAVPGANAGEIDVTPAAPGTTNVGTTLGVACVLGTGTSCPTAGSAFTSASDGIAATVTGLTNGATYECYAAEYLTADDSVVACSSAVPATAAPLNPPTVTSAVPGANSGEIDVTPAAPSTTNVGTTLGVACLLGTGTSCPTAGSSFTSATAGSATTFTGLTTGATYECYAAEYLTADDSVVACSAAVPATAAPLNPPTVTSAVPGASAGEIDVTPAAPSTTNVGTTLGVACVAGTSTSCPTAGSAFTTASDGIAATVTGLTNGATYECYAAEYLTADDSVVACSAAVPATAAPLNPPTVTSAVPGATSGEIDVTPAAPGTTNVGTTLGVACVLGTSTSCPTAGSSFTSATAGSATTFTGLNTGATYECYAAEYLTADDSVVACSSAVPATAAPLNPPTVTSAVPGANSGEIDVTPAAPSTTNVGTTLGVACVLGTSTSCPTAGSSFTSATAGSATTFTGLTTGAAYECYAAEYLTADDSVVACSAAVPATAAPLNPPTVTSAVPGANSGEIDVTPAAPSTTNVGTTLGVACVLGTSTSCPTAGSSFTSATAGSATTFTGLTNGAAYECYAAEYLTADDSVVACSAAVPATAAPLNPPTVTSAVPGANSGEIDVTPAAPSTTNVGTTLGVACVLGTSTSCPTAGSSFTSATAGSATTFTGLTTGAAYECYAAEYLTADDSVVACSAAVPATAAPLNPPTVTSAVPGANSGEIDVTPAAPSTTNVGTTLGVACVLGTSTSCPTAGSSFTSATAGSATTFTGLTTGAAYECYAAEYLTADDSVVACSAAVPATAAPLNPPTVTSAVPGANSGEIDVTPAAPSTTNVGTTLGVACVLGTSTSCPTAGSSFTSATAGSATTFTGLTTGAAYECYAAEYLTADDSVVACSAAVPATAAPLNPPTVTSAVPGANSGEIDVTPAAPSTTNVGTTLGVACVLGTSTSCPTAGSSFTSATAGSATTFTGLTTGAAYECYAAEYLTADDSVVACSAAVPATAAPLNPPTVTSAVPGANSGEIDVTPAAPSTTNVGTTLGVACVLGTSTSCPTAGSSFTSATAGSATTFTGLTNGAAYECYAAEYLTADDSVVACSSAVPATAAPLNPPTVTAATARVNGGIDVTPAAPGTANVGTSLGVACVATSAGCPANGSFFTSATAGSATTITGLTGGTSYDCYAAEYLTADNTVIACSSLASATANSLTAPTIVTATDGGGGIDITPTEGQTGSTLKVGCVVVGAGCPTWANASSATNGSSQTLTTLADGSATGMVSTTTYDCYAIEQDGGGQEICSALDAAVSG